MTPQSTTMNEASIGAPAVPVAATMHPTQPFLWSVRRELWENRWLYRVPFVAAALALVAFAISLYRMPYFAPRAIPNGVMQPQPLPVPYAIASMVLMATMFLTSFFYCLDALYGERRDRSILFWKSLPISDHTAVLAKAAVPFIVIPVITFVTTIALQLLMLLMQIPVFLHSGGNIHALWSGIGLGGMTSALFFHLAAVHVLWYAPIFGWLLFVSAWAPRVPLLWATLPWIGLEFLEKIAFNTEHIARFLGYRFSGGTASAAFPYAMPGQSMESMQHASAAQFLLSPGLWGGLVVAALLLFGAVQFRRSRSAF